MSSRDTLDLPDDGLLARIIRLNLAVSLVLDEITERAGIPMADYLVLAVIRRSPGRRSAPTAICEVLGRTTGGMSLTLDRLAAAGWVRRSVDRTDRRRVVVTLTPAGLRLATRVNRELHEWEHSLALPDDRAAIHGVLDALADAVAAPDAATQRGTHDDDVPAA
jgi:DNA-binding MarR family transcriptional regulator